MSYKPYYHTCPTCGANLDPNETCSDCKEESEQELSDKKKDTNTDVTE